jgi:hypothetical protein
MRRMKWLIVLALALVLATLGSAGVLMLRRKSGTNKDLDKRMAWALTARVAVSVAIFLFVLLAYLLGWIHPTGLRAGQ